MKVRRTGSTSPPSPGAERCTGSQRSPQLRRERQPGVLVTVAAVRGHAPREAGAKMVVGQRQCWGTIGGGNLEASAVRRARELLASQAREPETETTSLTERAPARHGVQCCGGEVTLLLRAAAPGARRRDLRDGARRHSSWPGSWPATTSSCTWSTPAPRRSTASGSRRPPRTPWPGCTVHHAVVPELVLGELPARQPRADHDPRPRRGRRPVRRRAALRRTWARSG